MSLHRGIQILIVFMTLILFPTNAIQTFDNSKIQKQIEMHWSFVSQIQHTWFKQVVNKYFQNCQEHQQLKALYNCNTTTQKYKNFWKDFINGVFLIKFKQENNENQPHNWVKMMNVAANQWITINKTFLIVQIQQAYEDISQFPSNLMQFAQFTQDYKDQFEQMKKIIKWQRSQKLYLSKNQKDEDQMKIDQTEMFKKYFNRNCFQLQNFIEQCKMPLQRYSFYLKDLFFYYFDQPQKYSKFDEKSKKMLIKPLLDYRITKLWREMRQVMRKHIGLQELVSLKQVQEHSVDILQSVMDSLLKTKNPSQKHKSNTNQNKPQQQQL